MKLNEYKNDVSSLRLSEQFKENLKKEMLKEYYVNGEKAVESPDDALKPVKEPITVSTLSAFAKKYYKAAAIAACLLLAISTISVATISGLKSVKSSDSNVNETQEAGISSPREEADNQDNDPADALNEADAAVTEAPETADEAEIPEDNAESEPETESYVTAEDGGNAAAVEVPETETVNEPENVETEDVPSENIPATDTGPDYSQYASPGYNGWYNGDYYLNTRTGTPDNLPETSVQDELEYNPQLIMSAQNGSLYSVQPQEAPQTLPDYPEVPNPGVPSGATGSTGSYAPKQGGEYGYDGAEAPAEYPDNTDGSDEQVAESEAVTAPEPPYYAETPAEGTEEEPEMTEEDKEVMIPIEEEDTVEEEIPVDEESTVEEEIPVGEEAPAEPDAPPLESWTAPLPQEAPEEPTSDVDEALEFDESVMEAPVLVPETMPAANTISTQVYSDYDEYAASAIAGVKMPSGLVRFTVEGVYEPDDLSYLIPGAAVDTDTQLLYKVRISYDYLTEESPNVSVMVLHDGSYSNQLPGQPVLQGEYIARIVTAPENSYFGLDDNLLYKIYRINSMDLAYHVVSKSGSSIDPGNTNMGLLPEESKVYTTAANNPETYTQKSSVKELTEYLKTSLLSLEPVTIDYESCPKAPAEELSVNYQPGTLSLSLGDSPLAFPDTSGTVKAVLEQMGAEIGDKSCNVITKDGNKAVFSDGILTGLDIVSPTGPLLISIRGCTVGTDRESAVRNLLLDGYLPDPDGVITVYADESDGGWHAEIRFDNNIINEIIIRCQ